MRIHLTCQSSPLIRLGSFEVLRRGTVHAGYGVVAILKRIVRAIRQRWPAVTLEPRAGSGFAMPALYAYCEAE